MEWTDTRPVVPGYYWVRFTDDRSPKQTIGEIADVPGNGSRQLVVVLLGDDEIMELDDPFDGKRGGASAPSAATTS